MVQITDLPTTVSLADDDLIPVSQNGTLKSATKALLTSPVSDGDKGDITVSNSGTLWNIDSGLPAGRIADGSVSSTEFQYLNSVTSNVQTQLDAITTANTGTNTGDQNLFGTIAVSGQDDVIADTTSDTLTFAAGANIAVTTNNATDTVTISAAGAGIPTAITVTDTVDATTYVALFEDATGNLDPKTDAGLTYDATTGMLTATGLTGPLTGNADTVTTNANLTGPITSTGNATAIGSQTGTGSTFVVDTSPTLVTPDIGVATATSVNKVTMTTPATSSTLTIEDGFTLTVSANADVSGTNTGDQTITLTGPVTGSGTGSFATTLTADSVTYDIMQDTSGTDVILGRSTAGAGTVEEISCTSAGRAILDDADTSAQRTTLGLAIGSDVQAYDAVLDDLAALSTVADNEIIIGTGAGTYGHESGTTARTSLGLAIGTDVQAYDATLASFSSLGTAADKIAYTTGVDTWAETAITSAGRAILDDADASAQRTTLGLAIGSDVQAYDADTAKTDVAQEYTKTQNFNATTLTDAVTIAWDASANQVTSVTLTDNRTLGGPTNLVDGATYILTVKQDGTGSRTLAYNAIFKFPGGTAPTLSTGINDIDILTFVSDGTNMYGVFQGDFS